MIGVQDVKAEDLDVTSYLGDLNSFSNGGWAGQCENNHDNEDAGAWWNSQDLPGSPAHSFRTWAGAYESWSPANGSTGVAIGRTVVLSSGNYTLTFKAFGGISNNASDTSTPSSPGDVVAFCTGMNNVDVTNTSIDDGTFHDVTFNFSITEDNTSCKFGLEKKSGKANWFQIKENSVSLVKHVVAPSGSTPASGSTYYLYNVGTGKFLSRGAAWDTQAVINESGVPFKVTIADGKYTLTSLNKAKNNDILFETTDHYIYTDYNKSGTNAATVASVEGGYTITFQSGTIGVANSNNNEVIAASTTNNNVWRFVGQDDYQKNQSMALVGSAITLADNIGETSSSAYTAAKAITISNTVEEIVNAAYNLYVELGQVPTFTFLQAASRNCFLYGNGVNLSGGAYNANNINYFRFASYTSSNGDSYLYNVQTGGFAWSKNPTSNESDGFYSRKVYPAKTSVEIDGNKWYFGVYGFDNTTPTKYINGYSSTSIGTYNNDKNNNENKWFGVPSPSTISLATLYNAATQTTTTETDNAKLKEMLDNFLVTRMDLYNNPVVLADAGGYVLSNNSGTLSLVSPADAVEGNVKWNLTYNNGASYLTNGSHYLAANGTTVTAVTDVASANAVTLYNVNGKIEVKLGNYYLIADGTTLSSNASVSDNAKLDMRSWARESLIIDGYMEANSSDDPTSSLGYDLIIVDAYTDYAVDAEATTENRRLRYAPLNANSSYQLWTTSARAAGSSSTEGVTLKNNGSATFVQNPSAKWDLMANATEAVEEGEYLFTILQNGVYTIEDYKYHGDNDKYWGRWSGGIAAMTEACNMAGNKQFFSDNVEDFGLFKVYYKVNPDAAAAANKEVILAAKGDATSLVVNPTFDENANGWSFSNDKETTSSQIDRYNGSSWRGGNNYYVDCNNRWYTITQTIKNMPAGTYKLVAAMRGNGFGIRPSVAGTNGDYWYGTNEKMINKNGVVMPVTDITKREMNYANDGTQWNWVSVTGELESNGDLTIAFKLEANKNCWACLDDVHLYYMSDAYDGHEATATYCISVPEINANQTIANSGKVVTCDLIASNPNAIISSDEAITGAAGTQINNNLVSGTVANLVLYDGYEFSADDDFTATAATLYRNIAAGGFATICAPFAISGGADGTFYEPTSLENDKLTFGEQGSPNAGKAYLYKATSAVTALTGAGTVKSATVDNGEGVVMKGTYSNISAIDYGNYVLSSGKLYKVDSDVSLNPFRAYFNIPSGDLSPARLVINLDDFTGINVVDATEAESDTMKDGKYIENNQLFIVKNGVKYSANGQILK